MATGKSGSFNVTSSNQYISGKVSWSETYDVASNTSSVTASLRLSRTNTGYETYGSGSFTIVINGTSYTNEGVFSLTYNSNTLCVSKTVNNIAHNSDGSKSITISVSGYIQSGSPNLTVSSQSGTAVLTTIPRASTISASAGTIGTAMTIGITRASSSFTHTLTYSFSGATGTIATKTSSTSVSWTPPMSLCSRIPSATSANVTITCTTYSGSSSVGTSTKTVKLSVPSSVKLTASSGWATASPYNTGTAAAGINLYIKGFSKVQVSFDSSKISTSSTYGATIASYKFVIDSATVSASPWRSGVLKSSGTKSVTCYVYDTRGRYVSTTISISVQNYSVPTLSAISVYRCLQDGTANDEGTYLYIKATANYTSLSGNNTITLRSRYKATGGSYGGYTSMTSGTALISGPVSSTSSYTVEISLADTLNGSDIITVAIPTASVSFNIKDGGQGAAFGKYAEEDNVLDVNWQMKISSPTTPIIDAAHGTANIGAYVSARRTDTGNNVSLGVGSGGINHGVYSGSLNRWLIYGDTSTVYVNESEFPTARHISTVSSIITPASDITIILAEAYTYGKLCQLRIHWSYGQDKNVPANGNISNITIGNLNSSLYPCMNTAAWSSGDQAGAAWYNITNATGQVALGACEGIGSSYTIAAGTEFRLFTTYILA